MNKLSNFLVDNIMSDYTPVVVYSGRFQPFHKGHYATYQHLVKKFGKDNVYIGTSDKPAPFNYADKRTIMTKMFGIPPNHIVQVKHPYSPVEIMSKFNPGDTSLVVAVGEKDSDRLGGKYYTPYTGTFDAGYDKRGYVYVAPKQPNPIRGTDVRSWLSKGVDSVASFLKAYPKFDDTVYKLVTQRLTEAVSMLNETTSMAVTNYYKAICNQLGVTPLPLKFGRVGMRGASTSWDSKTFKPLYISFDLSKVHDIERAVLHELAHQILLLKEKNPGHGSAFKKLESKLIDKYFYSPESKLLHEAYTKGNIYAGNLKINGQVVPVEVELVGVDNKTNQFLTKVLHIDKTYYHLFPIGSSLSIPARIFRFTGGWHKIKTPSAFESLVQEASGFGAFPHDGNATTGHYWNNDWDEFDDPEPYIGCLPGWEILPMKFNRLEQLKSGELPLNNHKDTLLKNNKLDLGIVPPQDYLDNPDTDPTQFLKKEAITLDVKIGDTILMGKFKNKKVVVKTIGVDDHGMPTINGKKVATFRMLKEVANNYGGHGADAGEPETSYTNAGAKRILNKTKPEPWFARGGYKQLDIPKADWIQGKSKKNRDNDSMLRKATYNVKNMKISKLDPATDPYKAEDWQEAVPGKKIKKTKRFWEENPTLVPESATTELADELMEELGIAMGYPSAEQVAAHEKELKRLRTKLNKNTTYSEPFALVGIEQPTTEMAMPALKSIEKRADDKFDPIDIVTANKETDHFFQRLNDPRNGKEITEAELQWFFDRLAKRKVNFIEFLKKYREFVVKDKRTNINIPFMRQANTLIAKTIMRKRDFMTSEPEYTIESLTEGGVGGHINHIFEQEMNLTFGDLKDIVKKALTGELGVTTEKCDGINGAISWIDGKLVMARNKSHLKNRGENAMGIDDIASKFTGNIRDAYLFAMKDLEKAIGTLSEKQRTDIFENGGSFMSLEVIYPEAVNVIPYGQSLLVFHNIFKYDIDGNRIGQNRGHAGTLADMIKQINQDVQDKFTIQGPPMTEMPKNVELEKLQPKYLAMINKLQSEFNLTDDEGLTDYHKAWWADFIDKNAPKLPKEQKAGLVDRWALNDKNFRIVSVGDEFKDWANTIDKQDKQKIIKDNSLKFEEIFLGVGADILSFMSSVLTVNPDDAKRAIVERLKTAIKTIRAGKDPKKIEILKHELARIQMLGGFDKIVPNEGIIFEYPPESGKVWKLTGNFSPVNRLLGLLYNN